MRIKISILICIAKENSKSYAYSACTYKLKFNNHRYEHWSNRWKPTSGRKNICIRRTIKTSYHIRAHTWISGLILNFLKRTPTYSIPKQKLFKTTCRHISNRIFLTNIRRIHLQIGTVIKRRFYLLSNYCEIFSLPVRLP